VAPFSPSGPADRARPGSCFFPAHDGHSDVVYLPDRSDLRPAARPVSPLKRCGRLFYSPSATPVRSVFLFRRSLQPAQRPLSLCFFFFLAPDVHYNKFSSICSCRSMRRPWLTSGSWPDRWCPVLPSGVVCLCPSAVPLFFPGQKRDGGTRTTNRYVTFSFSS